MRILRWILASLLLLAVTVIVFFLLRKKEEIPPVRIIDVEQKGMQTGFFYEEMEGGVSKYRVTAGKYWEGKDKRIWLQDGVKIKILSRKPVEITASEGTVWRKEKIYELRGNVEARGEDLDFFAPVLIYTPRKKMISAPEFASWEIPQLLGTGRGVSYHLRRKKIIIEKGGRIVLKGENSSIRADHLVYSARQEKGTAQGNVLISYMEDVIKANFVEFFTSGGKILQLTGQGSCSARMGEKTRLIADRLTIRFGEKTGFRAEGNVLLLKNGRKIRADKIEGREDFLIAKGNVVAYLEGKEVKGKSLKIEGKKAFFSGNVIILGKNFSAKAEEVQVVDGKIVLKRGSIQGKDIVLRGELLEKEENLLKAEGRVKGRFLDRKLLSSGEKGDLVFICDKLIKDKEKTFLEGDVLVVQGGDLLAGDKVIMEGEKKVTRVWNCELRLSRGKEKFLIKSAYSELKNEPEEAFFKSSVEIIAPDFRLKSAEAKISFTKGEAVRLEALSCREILFGENRGSCEFFDYDFSSKTALLKGKASFTGEKGTTSGEILRYFVEEKKLEIITEGGRTSSTYRRKGA